ncbi:1-pyrroline-5-carboxylate dehydrogenase [Kineococcus xinjiangensis]|uniref:L-glutamate gamma-semialdehyde dehydrogenase n=1 Tax=Kineococcus xinjiangensis TaxID=512762 RepID=A0A2S6ILY4_9ACTN|nr:L-glutamate gamma-semialdehyde dehydrogenase [Kineococcus xinjiangensis]PPK95254.1 1-pyrroline-5-carboxylate dehydrogenase [Kineococcus xinjiangensis]
MQSVSQVPAPVNEPVHSYAPGSPERARLAGKLADLAGLDLDLTHTIGGDQVTGSGERRPVVQPHRHAARLGTYAEATSEDAAAAVRAAKAAAADWAAMDFEDRAAVFLKAADLLAGPWRETLAAATMLGQSKTAQQAEIDTPCELVDFWRFNVGFARQVIAEQPISAPGTWNRTDHRPLEGFVYAVTPFNFTAIAGNLPTAPALMGNVVVWKPSPTQAFSAHFTMRLLEAAGLPPGVINLVHGAGPVISDVVLSDRDLAGIHFTGSTATFQHLWRSVGENIANYRTYPRLVGETGGKDFVLAHPSADPGALKVAMLRGAFEYSGQKCSAASRAYVPRSVWNRMGKDFCAEVDALPVGDVTDLSNFTGAVIDARAFRKNADAIERARSAGLEIAAGGTYDDSEGWFVRPTVILSDDPGDESFRTEYFGPLLSVHVYDDGDWSRVLETAESTSEYALTGAVIAQDRAAVAEAMRALRFAAGNFYVNDRPTGAVVGQQPFGGSRGSGTNDKAGSPLNLLRWVSPRSLKETFVPATDHRYPHMG